MTLVELGIIVAIMSTAIGGLFSFYHYYLKWKFWKPKIYLNNSRLVCVNDSKKEIVVIKITLFKNKKDWVAKKIRIVDNQKLQSTNIIYPAQSREIEFDIDIEKPKEGKISIEFQVDKKIIKCVIFFNKNTPTHFINNRQMRVIQR